MSAAALPCFEVGVATLCEQVPNGRNTTYKCTACQPALGKKLIKREQHDENLFSIILPSVKLFGKAKKPIKDWEKPLTLWKNKAHGFHAMRTGGKNIALRAG